MALGWMAVAAYAGLLVATSIGTPDHPAVDRQTSLGGDADAADRFVRAWERSREATYVAIGTYERRSQVTGASLSSPDAVAQRPPRRLHRQMGGVEGRDDDQLIVCPAPPGGQEGEPAPCRLGPHAGPTYVESVQREVEGLRSLTGGPQPLYAVREVRSGCFELVQRRVDPRAPFGVRASFCFDAATGAVSASSVRHEGGIVEIVTMTSLRAAVTDADLEP